MKLNLVLEYLKYQGEEKLGLARAVFLHHCNHPNVIPYYPLWGSGERLPNNYHCCVCRSTLQPQELLATYECTKRAREVAQGGADTPTGEEASGLPTRRPRQGSP